MPGKTRELNISLFDLLIEEGYMDTEDDFEVFNLDYGLIDAMLERKIPLVYQGGTFLLNESFVDDVLDYLLSVDMVEAFLDENVWQMLREEERTLLIQTHMLLN